MARRVGQAGRRRGPHARGLRLVRGAFGSRRRRWPEGPRFVRGRGGPGRRGDRGGEDERQTDAPRGIGASRRRERWVWARTEAGGTGTQLLGARLLRAGSVLPPASRLFVCVDVGQVLLRDGAPGPSPLGHVPPGPPALSASALPADGAGSWRVGVRRQYRTPWCDSTEPRTDEPPALT